VASSINESSITGEVEPIFESGAHNYFIYHSFSISNLIFFACFPRISHILPYRPRSIFIAKEISELRENTKYTGITRWLQRIKRFVGVPASRVQLKIWYREARDCYCTLEVLFAVHVLPLTLTTGMFLKYRL